MFAQVVRAVGASGEPMGVHHHDVELQFFYVIAGSMDVDYAGDRQRLQAGDCVVQPNGLRHQILSHSDDLELLEVTMPATHPTIADD